jgi:hypothetical protein
MLVLASIVFGLLGFNVTLWGFKAIRNRRRTLDQFRDDPAKLRAFSGFWWTWTILTFLSGLSMLAAAVLVWTFSIPALILGLWPIVFVALLMLISRRASQSAPYVQRPASSSYNLGFVRRADKRAHRKKDR